MNKEEMMKKFEANVEYLRRNIPPDDIYLFSEQTFMAALYFLYRWSKVGDIQAEMKEDEVTRKWVTNILCLQVAREKEIDVTLDLDMKSIEDE